MKAIRLSRAHGWFRGRWFTVTGFDETRDAIRLRRGTMEWWCSAKWLVGETIRDIKTEESK